jgi:ubiquinone/menaquinone biosynthesis C-methylase UbiE
MNKEYIHGYARRENMRLYDQASTLVGLLHSGTSYSAGSHVLEAGCGVGAQTVTLAKNSPKALITAVDISEASITEAKKRVEAAGFTNVQFQLADIFNLPYAPESFDHIFICFVLEHISQPVQVLSTLREYLRKGGTITVIEGDHGSAYFHPHSAAAQNVIKCLVELQRQAGGNALIGRELYPLLRNSGYDLVQVTPRMVYVDSSKPELVEGFTKKTFTAMIEGVRENVLKSGIMDQATFDKGVKDLYRTAEVDGIFCYTFFKAVARYN